MAFVVGYYVVDSSTTVGTAIADVNNSLITIPEGFSVGETSGGVLQLINKGSPEKIYIKDLGKKDVAKYRFTKDYENISQDSNNVIINNTTKDSGDMKVYSIYYKNSESGCMLNSYVNEFNHTYSVKLTNFNDFNRLNENYDYILKTLRLDFKKAQ